jgi:hypothetical protein
VESSKLIGYESNCELACGPGNKKESWGQGTSSGLTECTLIVKYFYRVLKLNFKFSK